MLKLKHSALYYQPGDAMDLLRYIEPGTVNKTEDSRTSLYDVCNVRCTYYMGSAALEPSTDYASMNGIPCS